MEKILEIPEGTLSGKDKKKFFDDNGVIDIKNVLVVPGSRVIYTCEVEDDETVKPSSKRKK